MSLSSHVYRTTEIHFTLSPVTEIQFIMIIDLIKVCLPNKSMYTLSYIHIIPTVCMFESKQWHTISEFNYNKKVIVCGLKEIFFNH